MNFAEKLRQALDIPEGQLVEFMTPQFTRTDGKTIRYYPNTIAEYEALPKLDPRILQEIGCQIWDVEDGVTTWLFPQEWFPYIPEGLLVTDINGEQEAFVRATAEDDCRFDALAFGFTKQDVAANTKENE
jgi:hypothetical protein